MLEQLEQTYQRAHAELDGIRDKDTLADWERRYLGKKGEVTVALRSTGQMPKEERADFGKRANEIKNALTDAFTARETAIQEHELARTLEEGALDVTLPGRSVAMGGLHPTTQTLREISAIWAEMGFQVFRSADVEDDETNFTLLNIPPHHPARDMWDTFHTTTPGVLLRTHTSPGQIRAMHELGHGGTQPIRVILPGMCYRYEQISARSEVQFNQVEGLAVGRNIRLSDLKGTIAEFARHMFGEDKHVRFRGSYFPFTEPSMEVDVECILCEGHGCPVCKYTGWLEIAGCGMVHPVVLQNGGYDPTEWSGFAFGMGPERMTMIKHGIKDIRYFWQDDLRFLEQF
ncbi:MAG TPA: phenylalanine--tRNA ligase subunit alpha [Aggregatilinea sp.]|uniref:phenylalanine--tRNA ligase subunit alpha n=1 Tax=Aggregatilinea sp. TaxID=2806333 RepID=UPI002BA82812|nr:phenylalanine--tRNA ligase subunit alpha [Aggregatilinea sp.]HML22919.1 phenylalanine--tRNA ligase subunit alpha [Aggregatilinea sp.]